MALKSLSLMLVLSLSSMAHADDGEMFPQTDATPTPAAAPSTPHDLLDACTTAIDKYKKAAATPSTTENKPCLDQINTSWKSCYTDNDNPEATKALYSTPGNGDQRLMAGYTTGKNNATQYSETCQAEQKKVNQVCGKLLTDVTDKLKGNSQATNGVEESLNTSTDETQRQSFIEQKNTLHDDSTKLQDEKSQLITLQSNGSGAMGDRAKCHANQASLYDSAINKTSAHLSSISSIDQQNPLVDTDTADAKGGSNSDVDSASKDLKFKAGAKAVGNVVGTELGDGSAMGSKAVVSLMTGDFGGMISDLASDGAGTLAGAATKGAAAGSIAGPVGVFVGATTSVALSSTPTSACDTINIDPVRAYSAGCSVNTTQAIGVLQSP